MRTRIELINGFKDVDHSQTYLMNLINQSQSGNNIFIEVNEVMSVSKYTQFNGVETYNIIEKRILNINHIVSF